MNENADWFEIHKLKDSLYLIRERLDLIDPVYITGYTNIYLLLGSEKALLIDTGAGLYPLRPVIEKIIENRKLIVVNTHNHFDHRGGNEEFDEVFIHESEAASITKPMNVFFLKGSPMKITERYKEKNFKFNPSKRVTSIQEGTEFDLGGINVKTLHTPGHSVGCVCFYTDRGELFTSDTAHYGTIFLPGPKGIPIFQQSIQKLLSFVATNPLMEIYTGHEEFLVKPIVFEQMLAGFANLENLKGTRKVVRKFGSWILEDETFKYFAPITPFIRRLFVMLSGWLFRSN
jgi:glyoxylase-like metal-dependent hydrolase (beta-lactamase superfamily II)